MSTTSEPRPIGPFAQWLLRPLGWPFYVVAAVASAFGLLSDVVPGGYMSSLIICLLLWLLLNLFWIACILTRLIVSNYYRIPLEKLKGGWKPWILIPLIQVALLTVTAVRLPFYTAFFISLPAMERVALATAGVPTRNQDVKVVGVYAINDIVPTPWGVRFSVNDAGFFSENGFAYKKPDYRIPAVEETGANHGKYKYTYVYGNWYQWEFTSDW